jgi:dihydrofolate reductase
MARFVTSMNVSLDGYVDYDRMAPDAALFRHWTEVVSAVGNSIYGRKIYELMRYWETEQPGWGDAERAFAEGWRAQKKWVVSTTLTAVGPNAELISDAVEARVRDLKAQLPGQVDICGTILARSLADWGLMDEYRLYYHPVVLGSGKPYFAAPPPALRHLACDRIGEVMRLSCGVV